jgi:hypothetical protein
MPTLTHYNNMHKIWIIKIEMIKKHKHNIHTNNNAWQHVIYGK